MPKSVPELFDSTSPSEAEVVLEVEDMVKDFPLRGSRQVVHAVRGVGFRIHKGETLALVGETGCGKTTVARAIAGLLATTAGRIYFRGGLVVERARVGRSTGLVQMVFQNPLDSLNPSMKVRAVLEETLRLRGGASSGDGQRRLVEVLRFVGLDERVESQYPGGLTSGEQQLVSIARAIAADPLLVVLDEPTSLLDAVARKQILEVLERLQREFGTAYLCISHDLRVVARLSHRIAVMYLGQIVEEGPTREVIQNPRHPYTMALMSSILLTRAGGRARSVVLAGEIPSAIRPPGGCPLHPRCPFAVEECTQPQHLTQGSGSSVQHLVACHRSEELVGKRAEPNRGLE